MDVTEKDYEQLSRYLDGELSHADAQALETRLARESALATSLGNMRALQEQLQSSVNNIDAGVPHRISRLLHNEPVKIVPLPHRRVANWGFALAASLVVAVAATQLTRHSTDPSQAVSRSIDALVSAALESSPSRGNGWETLADGRNIRPVLSFQSTSGAWCREYLLADGTAGWHGVACRGNEGWTTAVLTGTSLTASSADYRPAGSEDPEAVADFIDQTAADIPLDARQEAELIARDWQ